MNLLKNCSLVKMNSPEFIGAIQMGFSSLGSLEMINRLLMELVIHVEYLYWERDVLVKVMCLD